MEKEILLQKANLNLTKLPETKLKLIVELIEKMVIENDNYILNESIKELVSNSSSFNFLNEEEELYTANDVIR